MRMHATSHHARVAGVDGCRNGWVIASNNECIVVRALDEVIERFDLIGIDMPIGLLREGTRQCDANARRFLGARHSTIFSAPSRALLDHQTYESANSASRELFGKGVTRQAFNLFAKIREVDALAQRFQGRLIEVHPECSFAQMTGGPLPPKRQVSGHEQRLALIESRFGHIPVRLAGAARDDVLDAYAVLWSTLRYSMGTHSEFGDGSYDEYGLPMRIVS